MAEEIRITKKPARRGEDGHKVISVRMEETLLAQLDAMLTEGGTVTGTRFSTARQGEYLLVALAAECREEIGVSVGVEAE